MPKTNDAVLAAFIARKAEIAAALDRIRAASDGHFFTSPSRVDARHHRPRWRSSIAPHRGQTCSVGPATPSGRWNDAAGHTLTA